MPSKTTEELRQFHGFLTDKLRENGIALSPEAALDEWRSLYPQKHTFEEDVAAIQESLEDIAKGDRGIAFEEFDRVFRERHNLQAKVDEPSRSL